MVRAVAQRMALRYGAVAILGLSVSVWGNVLLGVGLLYEVVAFIYTPSAMEAWVKQTRFGKNEDKKFENWKAEEAALVKLSTPQ